MKNDVQINRLFTGDYLKDDNLGHEVINIFKCDNGNIYIYTMPTGDYADVHRKQVKKILLVRTVNSNQAQILAMADVEEDILASQIPNDIKYQMLPGVNEITNNTNELSDIHRQIHDRQCKYIEENGIQYGGVRLDKLYSKNITEKSGVSIYLTYKVINYKRPKEDLFLYCNSNDSNDNFTEDFKRINFKLDRQRLCGSALQIYEDSETPELKRLFNSDLWEENCLQTVNESLENYFKNSVSILNIIKKNNDELSYSNWLAYYLKNDRNILNSFISKITNGEVDISRIKTEDIILQREKDNIDLYYEDPERIIIIENKITSSINGTEKKKGVTEEEQIRSQLSKYYSYINNKNGNPPKKTLKCFLFLPNYSFRNVSRLTKYENIDKYKIIRYKELLDIFNEIQSDMPFYNDFKKALELHSEPFRNELYIEMLDRFNSVIIANKQ